MATKRAKSAASEKAMAADDGVVVPRLSLSEVGFTGLRTSNGRILQEQQQAFRYPHLIPVINEMKNNPTVSSALNVYNYMMTRKKWTVKGKSELSEERAEIITTMMNDMEDSWEGFIQSVLDYLCYGFSIHELVPYRRLKRNGSKYNDGLIGIKKLAIRTQETIERWNFSEDGRELLGVSQNISNLENSYKFQNLTNKDGLIDIPREKFLLFTASATAGNPQGNSILKRVYLAHKQLTLLQNDELLTIARDAKGLMKITIPPQYLSADAPDNGAAAEAFKAMVDGYNRGELASILAPQMYDPETKQPMFSYELMESKGTATIDVENVIRRLQGDILQNLSVDILALGGNGGSGSYALASEKTTLLSLSCDARLKEIQNTLNRELIPYICKMNGWSLEDCPYFDYEDSEDLPLEDYGSFLQKIFSVGAIEFDRPVANRVRKILGVPELDEDKPVDTSKLPANMSNMASRSGDGMAVGTSGNGTAKIGGDSKKTDPSTANVANK